MEHKYFNTYNLKCQILRIIFLKTVLCTQYQEQRKSTYAAPVDCYVITDIVPLNLKSVPAPPSAVRAQVP